ncbi:MAG: zinc-dependent alcohol dehydrogenase [Peptococcales bacterium]|jgi:threonine dehydrogenase-like Zn-dependent dehydrogenase
MYAQVLYGPNDLRYEKLERPTLKEGEVLLRVKACAMCASDNLALKGKHHRIVLPRILGHEFASVIEEVGTGVTNWKVGDRVVTNTNMYCMKCPQCKAGTPNRCKSKLNFGFKLDGAFSEFVKVPKGMEIFKLPDNISFEEGALMQPLGVALNAVKRRAQVTVGDKVAVLGVGPVGLCVAALAKASGAQVLVSDVSDIRLETAQKMGASEVVNVKKEDLIKKSLEFTNNKGFDIVIEAVGGFQDETLQQATQIVKYGGRVTVIGHFAENKATVRIVELKDWEMELKGAQGQYNTVPICIDLLQTGTIDLKPMITNYISLAEVPQGFELMDTKKDEVVKVIIKYD